MELGQIYKEEYDLAQRRIKEAKEKAPPGMNLFEVAIAVYVNGCLQYHGGHTIGINKDVLDRDTAKVVAVDVLQRCMDVKGDCTINKPPEGT